MCEVLTKVEPTVSILPLVRAIKVKWQVVFDTHVVAFRESVCVCVCVPQQLQRNLELKVGYPIPRLNIPGSSVCCCLE